MGSTCQVFILKIFAHFSTGQRLTGGVGLSGYSNREINRRGGESNTRREGNGPNELPLGRDE